MAQIRTMVELLQALSQPLQVYLSSLLRIQVPPKVLDASVLLILRLRNVHDREG